MEAKFASKKQFPQQRYIKESQMKKFTCLMASIMSCLSVSFASAAAIDKKAENGFDHQLVAVSAPLIGGQEAVLAKNDTVQTATVIQAKTDYMLKSIDTGALIVDKYSATTHKGLAYVLEKTAKMAAVAADAKLNDLNSAATQTGAYISANMILADDPGSVMKAKHLANELAVMQLADQPAQGGYTDIAE
jgi:hypothetical protein